MMIIMIIIIITIIIVYEGRPELANKQTTDRGMRCIGWSSTVVVLGGTTVLLYY